jgi:hypothetical protein
MSNLDQNANEKLGWFISLSKNWHSFNHAAKIDSNLKLAT